MRWLSIDSTINMQNLSFHKDASNQLLLYLIRLCCNQISISRYQKSLYSETSIRRKSKKAFVLSVPSTESMMTLCISHKLLCRKCLFVYFVSAFYMMMVRNNHITTIFTPLQQTRRPNIFSSYKYPKSSRWENRVEQPNIASLRLCFTLS